MSEKKQSNKKQKPKHEVRCGNVIASIYPEQLPEMNGTFCPSVLYPIRS